jgi:hypothetical protein
MEKTERRPTETRTKSFTASRSIRKYPVIGQVRDVDGSSWDIRDVRATKYGFDLLWGTPEPGPGAPPRNWLQLILTKELRDFWSENKTKHKGFLCDLPAANSTLNHARKRLGFKWPEDVAKFWTEHIKDLRMLRPRQFEAKYGMDRGDICYWRSRLAATQPRRSGDWWRTPETLGILLSGKPIREISLALGVSPCHAYTLRARAKKVNTKSANPRINELFRHHRRQSKTARIALCPYSKGASIPSAARCETSTGHCGMSATFGRPSTALISIMAVQMARMACALAACRA